MRIMYEDPSFELNIMQSIKEYTLKYCGSTVSEGEYTEIEDNSDMPNPYILIDNQFFWLEVKRMKVQVNWL